jgi:hypothetical protein
MHVVHAADQLPNCPRANKRNRDVHLFQSLSPRLAHDAELGATGLVGTPPDPRATALAARVAGERNAAGGHDGADATMEKLKKTGAP